MIASTRIYCLACGGVAVIDNGYRRCTRCTRVEDECRCEPESIIDHPPHYTFGNIEVIDAIEAWGFGSGFALGNAIKYIARAKHKGTELEDLKKARWYLDYAIRQVEGKT